MVDIRVGNQRVFAHNIEAIDLPLVDGFKNFGHGQAGFFRQMVCGPQGFKLFQGLRVGHFLVAGKEVRQSAHIAGALYVVLAPQGA